MSSGLGQSSDPAELIPGDPASLKQTAQQLATWAGALALAADGLRRIDTTSGWSGQAADATGPDRITMAQSSGGGDPDFDALRPAEQDTLIRLQEERPDVEAAPRGRYGEDPGYGYVDAEGRTYDQIGNPNASRFWTAQRTRFLDQIDIHLRKSVDYVVIDMN